MTLDVPQVDYDVDDSTITFNGGLTASAGSLTYGSAPSPNPPVPASAPIDVAATAGDASAVATWQAPVSSGSFPVTHYRAVSSPAGGTCLVTAPALTCDMAGLANGTTYTVTVQALTGAGWGPHPVPPMRSAPRVAIPCRGRGAHWRRDRSGAARTARGGGTATAGSSPRL